MKPFTPDDSVSSSGSASRSRTSPTMATSGAMRRKPATRRRRSIAGRSGRAGTGLHARHVRQRDVRFEDLLGDDDPQRRVQLRGAAGEQRGLARPGCARHHDRLPAAHARGEERRRLRRQHVALDELVEVAERHAGELPDVDHHVPAAADVAVHDVEAGAVVELRVLQALRRVELAVRRRSRRRGSSSACGSRGRRRGRPRRGSRTGPDAACTKIASGALTMTSQTSSSSRRGSRGP